jgi:Alginate lyase
MIAAGFYSPAQLAAIVAREEALTDLMQRWQVTYTPKPPATFTLPTRGTVPDTEWDAIFSQLVADTDQAHQCGLVWAILRTPRAAANVDQVINAYVTTTTAAGGGDAPLALAECGAGLVFADMLIADWTERPAGHAAAFRSWLARVYRPACDSIAFPARPNNWGGWGLFGSLLASRHLGDGTTFQARTSQLQAAIKAMIGPSGQMTQEMLRTGEQLWYSYFALVPLTAAARVVRNAGGPDLFVSTRLDFALEYLATLYAHQTPTTGTQVPTAAAPWPMDLFAAMAEEFAGCEPGYAEGWRELAAPFAPVAYWGHHTGWNVPCNRLACRRCVPRTPAR